MPRFEDPLPYRPDRSVVWPESIYNLRVDGLPRRSDSLTRLTDTFNFHASLPVNPHTHVRIQPFGINNWNTGAQAGYFIDRLPAGTSVAFNSSARRTWTALNPDAQNSGKHLYFSDLRQQGATKNLLTGEYTILPVFVQNDKHCILWSPDSDELVEGISYRGDRPESSHVATFITTDYEMPLGQDLVRKAGATASRFPVAPLYFTYQDLVDCGLNGDLGHMLGFTMEDGDQNHVWPARANDYTRSTGLAEGMVIRLKSSFDETVFTNQTLRALARTLKRHGAVVFDRSPTMRIATCNDPEWPSGLSNDWGTKVSILDFEVVDTDSVKTDSWTRRYPLEPPAGTIRIGCTQTSGSVNTKHEIPTGKPLGMHRRFISNWSQRGNIVDEIETAALNHRALHLSIKTPAWQAVANGNHDAEINAMWDAIRDTSTCIWMTFWHEPENDLDLGSAYTATHWRNMQLKFEERRVARGATNALIVPVLIDETIQNGHGPDWVIEDTSKFPLYGVDFYSNNYQTGPLDLRNNARFNANVNYLTARGIDICFPEVGGTIGTTGERDPLFLNALVNECLDPNNRIKGLCWFDNGNNELGGTASAPGDPASDPDGEVLAAFHAHLVADYSYRGGGWRGNPTGVIDSIRVTDLTPDVVVPPTDTHTIWKKVAGQWEQYVLRRKVAGQWVNQAIKRITE